MAESTGEKRASGKRLRYIDVAKGICILSILLGHMSFIDANGSNVITPIVFQYHVPVFFLISGLFLKNGVPFGDFLRKRAKGLLLPYAITCLILLFLLLVLRVVNGHIQPPAIWSSLRTYVRSALWGAGYPNKTLPQGVDQIGAIWFLEALFVASLEVYLVTRFCPSRPVQLAIVAVLFLVAVATRTVFFLPFNVQPGLVGGLYVYCGYLYRQRFGTRIETSPILLVVLALIYALGVWKGWFVSMVGPTLDHGVFDLLVSLTSSYLVLMVSVLISEHLPAVTRFLEFYGKDSLVFLCAHLICMDFGFWFISSTLLDYLNVGNSHNRTSLVNLILQFAVVTIVLLVHRAINERKGRTPN